MSKICVDNSLGICSLNDEQLKVFKEALFKSKGQSNNEFGVELVLAGATSDEVAKFASRVEGRAMLTKSSKGINSAPYRAVMQVVRRVPNFWDTVKGRNIKSEHAGILAKLGINTERYLPVTKFDAKLSDMYLQTTYRVTGESYCMFSAQSDLRYDSITAGKVKMAEIFSPLSQVKFLKDNAVIELVSNTTRNAETELPDYDKNRAYDIDSLAHMDEAITSQMSPRELMADLLRDDFEGYFRHNPTSTYSIKIMCIMEGFYEVCREMGIVGILDGAANGRYYVSGATLKGIMQNVIKMAGTYRRLVKSGFGESVARETVLAEINDNIIKRASRPQVRFYGRNDYKDTPAEEREKVKKVSKSSTGKPKRRVLTLEDL